MFDYVQGIDFRNGNKLHPSDKLIRNRFKLDADNCLTLPQI